MENEPVNKIVVTEQTGREALELAAHSYEIFTSTQTIRRSLPGRTVGGTLVLPFEDWCS